MASADLRGRSRLRRLLRARPGHGKRGGQRLDRRLGQTNGPLGGPARVAVGCHGLQLRGQFPRVVLLRESEVQLRPASFPHDRRCIVADRMAGPDKTPEQLLHFLEPGPRDGLVRLHDGQEMDS